MLIEKLQMLQYRQLTIQISPSLNRKKVKVIINDIDDALDKKINLLKKILT